MRHWIVAAAAAALLWPASAGAASPTADQMASNVAQVLKESGRLKGYAVGVKYEDGVAWLEGRVTSEEQSATAAELARQVSGVAHVINKLEIVAPEPAIQETSNKEMMLASLEQAGVGEAPARLPPNPSAMPAAMPTANRGMPRPMARTAGIQARMPQGQMQQRQMHPGQMQQGRMQQGQVQPAQYGAGYAGGAMPQGQSTAGAQGASYDQANMPNYAWPSYAAHPNYAAVSYPKQYSAAAWPYIGPFHPYPQVPLGWRKVTLEWDDGWWNLDFSHQ